MRRSEPPRLATWMLEHFTFGCRNLALVGDLYEEFRSGRAAGWYWRQVISAIAIAMYRAAGNYGTAVLFALVWSMLVPAWLLIVAEVEKYADLNGRFYRMDWPWSTVCDLGILLLANLVFIWIGIVLYQVPDLFHTKGHRVRQAIRGIVASVPALIVVSAALIAVPKYFIDLQTAGRSSLGPVSSYAITHLDPPEVLRLAPQEEWSAQFGDGVIAAEAGLNPIRAITDVSGSSVLVRLPFFLVVFCALWRARRLDRIEQEGICT